MTGDELRELLEPLGPDGKKLLAAALPVSLRSVDRWLSSARKMHPAWEARVREVVTSLRVPRAAV
jgi:hypothetical protein